MGVTRETVGDMGFGLPQGWAVKIDTEGSLELGRGVENCRLLSVEIKNKIIIMIHSPT